MSEMQPYQRNQNSPLFWTEEARLVRQTRRELNIVTAQNLVDNEKVASAQQLGEATIDATFRVEDAYVDALKHVGAALEGAVASSGPIGTNLLADAIPGIQSRGERAVDVAQRRLLR